MESAANWMEVTKRGEGGVGGAEPILVHVVEVSLILAGAAEVEAPILFLLS